MRLTNLVFAALVLAVLTWLILGRDPAMAQDAQDAALRQEAEAEAISVIAQMSERRPVQGALVLRGRTEAVRLVEVKAQIDGLVISEPLRAGAEVAAGDLLCEIDPGTRQVALAEARAGLAQAEADSAAGERLAQSGNLAENVAIARRAALEAARAAVERAETELDRLIIRTPFDGLLETDTAELGTLMQPGTLCATVISLSPIKIVGFVPEREVGRVRLGAPVLTRLVSGVEVQGRVTFLSRSADLQTRTFRVEVEVPNEDRSIRDGETAELLISIESEEGHLVPPSALTLDDAGRLGVRIVEAGAAQFAEVSIVRDTPDGTWVRGLGETADVIVRGQEYVVDGTPVAVTRLEDAE